MSVYEPNSRHLREVLIFCFNMKKSAAEAHRMLSNTYGEADISERMCRQWFQCFKMILTSKIGIAVEDRRCKIGGITWARLVSKSRRIGTIIGSDSTSHFKTPQSHGNDSEARKLSTVRIEAERCWTALVCVNSCLKGKDERDFCIALWLGTKNEFITIIPSAENHGEFPAMLPRRRPNRIFTAPRSCSVFGGTSSA